MEPWKDLTGKVVMVTGASSEIGYEFCLDLAKAGCRVIAAARRVDRLKALCDQINAEQGPKRAIVVELDVSTNGSAIEASVQIAWDAFGHIDALVNNASVRGSVDSSVKVSEEEWNNTHNTNVRGAWLVAKYICRHMIDAKQGGGCIINISSAVALYRAVLPGSLAYASSKMALHHVTKMMAFELGGHNIRVNSISPGFFKSEMAQNTIPIKPALTSVLRYLIHDSSEYVTGNVFIVDGGGTLPGIPISSSL